MKKILGMMLALAMCLSLFACSGNSNDNSDDDIIIEQPPIYDKADSIPKINKAEVLKEGSCGNSASFKLYDNYVMVISGSGAVTEKNFESYKRYIKFIVIEKGITTIGKNVFSSLSMLQIVELPSSIKSIEDGAFKGCYKLSSINLPEGLNNIGEEAFMNCGLTSLTIPSTISTIKLRAFNSNSSLTSIIIPGTVKTVEGNAFAGCDNVKLIIICKGVQTLGAGAFYLTGAPKVAIPDSVTSMGTICFNSAIKLYCNEGSYAAKQYPNSADVIVGYDGFVKNYDLP